MGDRQVHQWNKIEKLDLWGCWPCWAVSSSTCTKQLAVLGEKTWHSTPNLCWTKKQFLMESMQWILDEFSIYAMVVKDKSRKRCHFASDRSGKVRTGVEVLGENTGGKERHSVRQTWRQGVHQTSTTWPPGHWPHFLEKDGVDGQKKWELGGPEKGVQPQGGHENQSIINSKLSSWSFTEWSCGL